MKLREAALLHISLRDIYGQEYMNHCMEWHRYNRLHRIFWTDENIALERKVSMMLEFKNSKGEIVMSEKDNGDLSIHDEVLKESFEKKISLEEAKKKEEEK